MSQIPPPSPPPTGQPRSNALALAALSIAILSPVLAIFASPLLIPFVAPLAIVLGLITLVAIVRYPLQHGGRAVALAGIGIAGATLLLFFAPLVLFNCRDSSKRSTCSANLRGIAQSLVVYAADNNNDFPYLGPSPIIPQPALARAPGGLMHDLFILVSNGQVGAKQLLCKSDPAKTAVSSFGPGITYWTHPAAGDPNFCYSYSFAFQYDSPTTLAPFWKNTVDASLVLAADMNPGTQLYPGKTIRNSFNHQGDGQNIAFGDAHAEFTRTPDCGPGTDNFYHIGPTPPAPGAMPFPAPGTPDTCLQPILLNSTTYTRG